MIRIPTRATSPLVEAMHTHLDPAWRADARRLRSFLHLTVTGYTDGRTSAIVFNQEVMAALRGWDSRRHDTGVVRFLYDLQEDLPEGHIVVRPYEWSPGDGGPGYCTQVAYVHIPEPVAEALAYDRAHFESEPLYDVVTRARWRPQDHARAIREQQQREAPRAADTPEEIDRLVGYLHAQPPRGFNDQVAAGAPLVRQILDDPAAPFLANDNRRRQVENHLRALREQAVPIYGTTGRTQRPIPHGMSLLTAPGWMRRVLLPDCVEADMAAAQLAVVAALWDVPEVRAYLASGLNVWDDLVAHLRATLPGNRYRLGHRALVKAAVKVVVYAACFCMAEENLLRFGNPNRMGPAEHDAYERRVAMLEAVFAAPIERVGNALLAHSVLAALLKARRRRMQRVRQDGGLTDVFGRHYRLADKIDGRAVTARSAMAAEAQAIEQYVMLGAAEPFVAEAEAARVEGRQPEASIMLWQSDGFTFRTRRPDRAERWLRRADAGLQAACQSVEALNGLHPILTRMEAKYTPGQDDPDPRQTGEFEDPLAQDEAGEGE